MTAWTKEEEKMRAREEEENIGKGLFSVSKQWEMWWDCFGSRDSSRLLMCLCRCVHTQIQTWRKTIGEKKTDSHSLLSPFVSSTFHLLLFHNSQFRLPVVSPKLQIWISPSCVLVFLARLIPRIYIKCPSDHTWIFSLHLCLILCQRPSTCGHVVVDFRLLIFLDHLWMWYE